MPEITEAQVASVLPYVARGRRGALRFGNEWRGAGSVARADAYANPATIASRLNEPLRECGECIGTGLCYPPTGGTQRDRPCPKCNGTGTIDPHADLRAFLLRVATEKAAHCVTPATCDDPPCEHARALVEALS